MLKTIEEVDHWVDITTPDGNPCKELWLSNTVNDALWAMVNAIGDKGVTTAKKKRDLIALVDYFVGCVVRYPMTPRAIRQMKETLKPLTTDDIFPAHINRFVKHHR